MYDATQIHNNDGWRNEIDGIDLTEESLYIINKVAVFLKNLQEMIENAELFVSLCSVIKTECLW